MGKWGNGKMGKWENGEMGKWENGEMGKWENGEMGKWENGRMGKWALRLTLGELSEIKNQIALKNKVFQGYIFSINHQT
jgi:hypothetical protein